MSRSGFLLPGVFLTFALSIGSMVLFPFVQIGGQEADFKEEEGLISEVYPIGASGLPALGKEVYISQGCQACHTQIIRGVESADIERGWGGRRTVARDYMLEKNVPFGAIRLGPDLANVGSPNWRNEPKDDPSRPARDAKWQFLHLYNPSIHAPYSNMPSYKHLFELRKVVGVSSVDALGSLLNGDIKEGYEVVPSAEAKALVAYLGSLDHSRPLKEAGVVLSPQQPK